MIGISMRMTRHSYPAGGEETRDALAQDWWRFLNAALPGVPVVPLPNIGEGITVLLQRLSLSGVILSGGDDWGIFPERDRTETALIGWAERQRLPLIGVCRGAQVLNLLQGGHVRPGFDTTHIRTRHTIRPCAVPAWPPAPVQVTSYHACAIRQEDLAPGLCPRALADDGTVEAFTGDNGRLTGIMWHPEREPVPQEHDLHLFQHCFRQVRK